MHWVNIFVVPAVIYGCLYGLVATSFNVLERTTRVLNFANGYLIMWAPMAALVVTIRWGWPPVVGVLLGIAFSVLLAIIVEVLAIRPFIGQQRNLSWILSTWGASVILGQLAVTPFNAQDEPFSTALSTNRIAGSPIDVSPQTLLVIGLTAVVFGLLWILYRKTLLGHMLIAVAEDFDGARALGISPGRMSRYAAIISALVGAATGLAFAPVMLVSPNLGSSLTLPGFVAAALGGLGSIGGGLLGAFVVGAAIQATAVWGFSQWSDVVLFSLLLVVFLFRPWGLFGHRPARAV